MGIADSIMRGLDPPIHLSNDGLPLATNNPWRQATKGATRCLRLP
jgi:hypothetical protein